MPQWARVSFLLKCVLLATSAVVVTSASGKGPTCTSHYGVPDFALVGKPPQKQRSLTFCHEYKASTCCDKETTDNVRRVVYNMQSNQFSAKCRDVSSAPELDRTLARDRSPPLSPAPPRAPLFHDRIPLPRPTRFFHYLNMNKMFWPLDLDSRALLKVDLNTPTHLAHDKKTWEVKSSYCFLQVLFFFSVLEHLTSFSAAADLRLQFTFLRRETSHRIASHHISHAHCTARSPPFHLLKKPPDACVM